MIDIKQLVINPDEINVLRNQLDEVFKAVEVRALEVEADMAPKNLDQAEYVESQLQEALKHVQTLKKKMVK
jgi:predicted  nucleic acid-binding Zn-ribbon protein